MRNLLLLLQNFVFPFLCSVLQKLTMQDNPPHLSPRLFFHYFFLVFPPSSPSPRRFSCTFAVEEICRSLVLFGVILGTHSAAALVTAGGAQVASEILPLRIAQVSDRRCRFPACPPMPRPFVSVPRLSASRPSSHLLLYFMISMIIISLVRFWHAQGLGGLQNKAT